ncbi:purple acid phosphatase family protein [Cyclobacterium jeungdonense]|uniref:Metallophosphoesterase family protein n=1 Tax=Cyclobacterium jeungdonense TaxID=708087 RepID=A0ABT8C5U3_9BACT|nr:metallophosphoesterase family protein [Cyclobacterium jeungdonense]MDN3687845.1 metallophosphoesterase family protein [Cyclobacterium jeungdonense]
MKKSNLLVYCVWILTLSCGPHQSADVELLPVSETMDGIVTRMYEEWDSETLDTVSHEFIENYLSEEEKASLSTQYWKIRINVPATVSLMRDKAQEKIPFWLEASGFEPTGMGVKNEIYTYEVWQKDFEAGEVRLGINGFGKHRPVYFLALAPQNPDDSLTISPVFPEEQHIETLESGAFTYHDWDGLTITEVPEALKGQQLLTTIRGRAREAHLVNAFRSTAFPSSEKPDHLLLTWSEEPSTSIDIQWRTSDEIAEGSVRYWENGTEDTVEIMAERYLMEDRLLQNDRYMHRFTAKLRSLNPGTMYGYVAGNEAGGWSEPQSFSTAAAQEMPFSFIWFGDVHNSEIWGNLIQKSETQHPDTEFYYIAGDLVNTGLYRNDWDELFEYAGETISRKPLLAVPGNHDSQDGLGAWMYERMLSLPSDSPPDMEGRTYAFDYQNTLFLMIDVTLPLEDQTAWIESKLKESEATWKIAVFHFPPYNGVEPYEDIQDLWGPLFDQYHVDLVMGGHFHYYMRSKPLRNDQVQSSPRDGTIYWISIGTTGKNEDIPREPYAEVQFPASHLYQYITIDGNELRAETVNLDGEQVEQFSINK